MAEPSTSRSTSARTGALIFTGLSVLLAASGGWLLWRLLAVGGYDREPVRAVVVAVNPIGAGHPLRAEDLRIVPWPASAVPAGAFSAIEPLVKSPPAVPTSGFVAGEPILKERLASPEAGAGLAALVGKDNRAVTIQLDRAMAAARVLYPGAHVDVIVTLEDKAKNMVLTRTVLEDVRVLAVGMFADIDAARRGADREKAGTDSDAIVTLEVSPPDAEKLALSARQGKLDLSLRNATDHARAPSAGIAMNELVQGGEPATGDPLRVVADPLATGGSAPPRSKRSGSSASPGSTPPTTRSFPRQNGSDEKRGGSTIEVYSVPTQAR